MEYATYYTNDEIAPGYTCRTLGGSVKINRGDIYRAFGSISSVVGTGVFVGEDGTEREGNIVVKSASGFNGSLDDCYEALSYWKASGKKGAPSSPASFFRHAFMLEKKRELSTRVSASSNSMRKHLSGGWIEAFMSGYNYSRIYHYDINRAYLGAIGKGLPSRTYPYTPKMPGFVVLAKNVKGDDLPGFFQSKNGVIITSEDLDTFPIESFDVVTGVSFRDFDVNLNPTVYNCSELPPRLFKRITQAFWGVFAMRDPVEVEYRNGNSRLMHNYLQNVVWAQLIIRRVAAQVYKAAVGKNPVAVFVDSVLMEEPIAPDLIGEDPGTWKHVDTYDRGIYIVNPGMWHPLPFNPKTLPPVLWKKHMGYSSGR